MKSPININSKIISLLWTVLIAVSLFYSFLYINKLDLRSGEQWGHYYSVFTDDVSSLETLFIEKKIPFLSSNESSVLFNDISSMKSLSLKDIPNRFNPIDPRLDPYMEKVDQLFGAEYNGEDYSIIYVEKKGISLWGLYLKLLRSVPPKRSFWSISGFEPLKRILPLCFFILFYGILFGFSRGSRWTNSAAMLGWIPLIYLFGYLPLFLAIVYFYFIVKNRSILSLSSLVIVTIVFLYSTQNLNNEFLSFFLLGLFSLSLLITRETYSLAKRGSGNFVRPRRIQKIAFRKPEHELFSPVQIINPSVKNQIPESGGSAYLMPLVICCIVLTGLFFSFQTSSPSYYVPLPVELAGLQWDLPDTEKTIVRDALLTPADYITHLAFQEGFLYGADWTYPHRDAPLLYPVFSKAEKKISKNYEIIADYSDEWFEERIQVLGNDNPATILFSTDHPGYVIKKMNHLKSRSFTLLNFSFSVLILLLIIFKNGKTHLRISLRVRKKLLRRNEKVA